MLRGVGDTLYAWRKRERYKESGEQAAETCSEHLAALLNQAWAQMAPALMQSLNSKCPAAIPLCVGLAFAFGPAVMEDIRESGAARIKRGLTEERPRAAARPEPEEKAYVHQAQPGPTGLTGKPVTRQ
jgi:hypothetical protein